MTRHSWAAAIAIAVAALALSACTPTTEPVPSPTERVNDSATGLFTGSRHEYAVANSECLNQLGWDTRVSEVSEDGGQSVIADFPADQQSRYAADQAACTAEIGEFDSGFDDPSRIADWYDFQLERRECLIAAGWAIGPAPSFQVVTDGYAANGFISWTAVDDVPPGDLADAQVACPDSATF